MQRSSFLMKAYPGARADALAALAADLPAAWQRMKAAGASNFTVWQMQDLIFGYYEAADPDTARTVGAEIRALAEKVSAFADLLASPGNMHRMYTALGHVREDKSRLTHRVFATRLYPGMIKEYRDRHAAIETEDPAESPVNNFTIWNCGDYICGYAEMDEGHPFDKSAAAQEGNRAWETAMLNVMAWITDDVNSLFGFDCPPVVCLFNSNL